jgi:hypothetical protein
VWESDHTIAVVLGALRPMLGAEAIADVYKSESPAWGKRGFLMEKRRVGTARFMSRSTAADKGSTDNGAGSGPRPSSYLGRFEEFSCACVNCGTQRRRESNYSLD